MPDADEREKELRANVSECLLGHWKLCVAGVVLGTAHGIVRKNYTGLFVGGLLGTVADFLHGHSECKPQQEELDAYLVAKHAALAQIDANDAAQAAATAAATAAAAAAAAAEKTKAEKAS